MKCRMRNAESQGRGEGTWVGHSNLALFRLRAGRIFLRRRKALGVTSSSSSSRRNSRACSSLMAHRTQLRPSPTRPPPVRRYVPPLRPSTGVAHRLGSLKAGGGGLLQQPMWMAFDPAADFPATPRHFSLDTGSAERYSSRHRRRATSPLSALVSMPPAGATPGALKSEFRSAIRM